jgi:outer membrane protein assembly factor BamE (lipoprotein component of BamABCDE complex)
MKRFVSLISALFLTLVLSGCGSTGKNFPAAHVEDIYNGITTQSQILDWFGVPFKEGMRNAEPMWTYQFDAYNSVGEDKSKELVILFDKDNIVKAYRYASNME